MAALLNDAYSINVRVLSQLPADIKSAAAQRSDDIARVMEQCKARGQMGSAEAQQIVRLMQRDPVSYLAGYDVISIWLLYAGRADPLDVLSALAKFPECAIAAFLSLTCDTAPVVDSDADVDDYQSDYDTRAAQTATVRSVLSRTSFEVLRLLDDLATTMVYLNAAMLMLSERALPMEYIALRAILSMKLTPRSAEQFALFALVAGERICTDANEPAPTAGALKSLCAQVALCAGVARTLDGSGKLEQVAYNGTNTRVIGRDLKTTVSMLYYFTHKNKVANRPDVPSDVGSVFDSDTVLNLRDCLLTRNTPAFDARLTALQDACDHDIAVAYGDSDTNLLTDRLKGAFMAIGVLRHLNTVPYSLIAHVSATGRAPAFLRSLPPQLHAVEQKGLRAQPLVDDQVTATTFVMTCILENCIKPQIPWLVCMGAPVSQPDAERFLGSVIEWMGTPEHVWRAIHTYADFTLQRERDEGHTARGDVVYAFCAWAERVAMCADASVTPQAENVAAEHDGFEHPFVTEPDNDMSIVPIKEYYQQMKARCHERANAERVVVVMNALTNNLPPELSSRVANYSLRLPASYTHDQSDLLRAARSLHL